MKKITAMLLCFACMTIFCTVSIGAETDITAPEFKSDISTFASYDIIAIKHDNTIADIMAIGAAKAALAMERRIPEDISIIGFDGIEAAEYYNPALDTVAQPAGQMAQHAVDAMMEMLNGGKTSHIVLESDLIRRGSSTKVR